MLWAREAMVNYVGECSLPLGWKTLHFEAHGKWQGTLMLVLSTEVELLQD